MGSQIFHLAFHSAGYRYAVSLVLQAVSRCLIGTKLCTVHVYPSQPPLSQTADYRSDACTPLWCGRGVQAL